MISTVDIYPLLMIHVAYALLLSLAMQLIEDMTNAPNYWSEEDIRQNIIDAYPNKDVSASPKLDGKSIMAYP